jgi:hypothetical protein
MKPTFDTKVDRVTQAGDRINLVIADDINQLKDAIDKLYDMFETVNIRTCIPITKADFTASYYDNSKLVGLTPDVDFRVFTNEGSGTLLIWDEEGYGDGGYVFDSARGRLTMNPQGYSIEIYTPVTVL